MLFGLKQFWRPQGPLIRVCEVPFHGCSNDNISGRGRLWRPEISPKYPLQPSPILVIGVKDTTEKLFTSVNDTAESPANIRLPTPKNEK
jgi:hypothetical protein